MIKAIQRNDIKFHGEIITQKIIRDEKVFQPDSNMIWTNSLIAPSIFKVGRFNIH